MMWLTHTPTFINLINTIVAKRTRYQAKENEKLIIRKMRDYSCIILLVSRWSTVFGNGCPIIEFRPILFRKLILVWMNQSMHFIRRYEYSWIIWVCFALIIHLYKINLFKLQDRNTISTNWPQKRSIHWGWPMTLTRLCIMPETPSPR